MRHRTRVCAFLADLAAIPDRMPALVGEVRALSGGPVTPELSFVGFRQSRPVHGHAPAYQPYVTNGYGVTRLANTALRLSAGRLAPRAAAAAALRVCGPAFVEAVLACDPELVLIDVRWGDALAALLERELPGAVFVVGGTRPGRFVPRSIDPSQARVSIVLPTYNGSRYIRQSLASCLEQSHSNLEVIVVDDGSRDDMAAVVGRFGDGRVRYVRHATNRGLPAALNTGFSHATGDLLTWTSDDNYYAPDAIERMAAFLVRHPDIAFVYTSMFIVDDTGAGVVPRVRPALPPGALHQQNGVGACFLYTREVYRTVGEYDAAAALVEDYDYWVRISTRFRMQRLCAPLYYYRHHDGSLTSQHGAEAVAVRFDLVRQQNGMA